LVSTVRPNLNGVAIVNSFGLNITASTGYCVLRANEELSSKYLFYWVQTNAFVKDMTRKAIGANYPAVSDKIIMNSKIPLPPLPIQQKIAAILDAADLYRQKTKALIEKYDELAQSLFLEMFGDPVSNEKGWERQKLGSLGIIKSGGTPSRSNPDFYSGTIPWITTVALGHRRIDKADAMEFITEDSIKNSATKLIVKHSVLVGVRVGVGKASINDCDICISQDILALTDINQNVNKQFLLDVLSFFKSYFESQKRGATIQGITSKTIKELDIICPPISLQDQFAQHIQGIEVQKALAQKALEKADELFNSLLQKAFKGELI
jgi:type I restriction enzyme, S subunit